MQTVWNGVKLPEEKLNIKNLIFTANLVTCSFWRGKDGLYSQNYYQKDFCEEKMEKDNNPTESFFFFEMLVKG